MLSPCPIIFSGHNDRAVVALCRYFDAVGIPFFLIARYDSDAISRTQWGQHVLFRREDAALTVQLMRQIARTLEAQGLRPVLSVTSEFLNRFVLDNRESIAATGWDCGLPERHIYLELSDKQSSPAVIRSLIGLQSPPEQEYGNWISPCVLKPKHNLANGQMFYPILCQEPEQLTAALDSIDDMNAWFSQKWIDGQSLYLCAYLDRRGHFDSYWQENLLQQAGGKSVVLARTTANPGINVTELMAGLHSKGYFGPFMMEIMRDRSERLFFIEVNPRFWGPLNLSLKACPSLLCRFAIDHGLTPQRSLPGEEESSHWYAWAFGARDGFCRRYPAVELLSDNDLTALLQHSDVYAAQDTQPLSGNY